MEGMAKKQKELDFEIYQLNRDNIEMRQDISTYECKVDQLTDIGLECGKMAKTVDLRTDRLQNLIDSHEPMMTNFLDGIIDNIAHLNVIS